MQQFQVPQFINIEDRIIGPLTLKQFFYLLGAVAVGLIGWRFLYFPLFIIFAVPIVGLLGAMAVGKVDGRPFPVVFMNAINYFSKPHLYLWKQSHSQEKKPGKEMPVPPPQDNPLLTLNKMSASKLSDLAWSLDIKEKIGR